MKKHTHRHHIQLLKLPALRDHHVFLALFFCVLSVFIVATTVRIWKGVSYGQQNNSNQGPVENIFDLSTSILSQDLATDTATEQGSIIPTELPRALDGIIVAKEESNLTPICVMIENLAYEGVRPQYGLSQASIIYEVIVEGGITRFMAVFPGPGRIDMIGPVRSARDTYLEFASEYNCAYIHAGGSFTALQALRNLKMRDVDGLIESKYFWREKSRYAPHNFFTSMDNLRNATRNHHWYDEGAPTFVPWFFQDKLTTENSPQNIFKATRIDIAYGTGYDVSYNYDPETGGYKRKNGGSAHIDAGTQTQLAPQTVVIQHVGAGIPIEGKGRVNWSVTGEGAVDIFHDGYRYSGLWKKKGRLSRTEFVDMNGEPIPLARGQVWIEIVPEHITSTYFE